MTTRPAQPAATTTPGTARPRHRSPLIWTALLLVIVLSLVFRQSFNLRYVAFSNDGPLGQMVAGMNKMPSVIMGLWVDLNWLGYEALSPPPGITSGDALGDYAAGLPEHSLSGGDVHRRTRGVLLPAAIQTFADGLHFGRAGGGVELGFFLDLLLGRGVANHRVWRELFCAGPAGPESNGDRGCG